MPINPNIALGVQQPQAPDLIGSMGQAMTLRNMVDQQKLRDMQMMGLQRQFAQEDALKTAGVLGPDGNLDEAATMRNLSSVLGPIKAQQWKNQTTQERLSVQKAEAEKRKADLDDTEKRWSLSAQQLFPILAEAQQGRPVLPRIQKALAHLESVGIQFDRNNVPQSEQEVGPWLQQQISMGASLATQLEDARARLKMEMDARKPQTPLGQNLRDQRLMEQTGGQFDLGVPQSPFAIPAQPAPGVSVQPAPQVGVQADPDMTADAIKVPARNPFEAQQNRIAYGEPPRGYYWNNEGTELIKIPGFEDPEKKTASIKDANALRQDFVTASKDFVIQRDAFTRIKSSAREPSAAGDLALIFNYMKLLDPGSTVREGEFATAQNAAGVPQVVQSYYNRVMTGERLADEQRADFVKRAGMIYNDVLGNHKRLEGQYTDIAKRNAIDPRDVVISYRDSDGPTGDAPKPQANVDLPKAEGPKVDFNLRAMPDPSKHEGRVLEAQDGTRYKSNGKKWVRQ